MFPIRDENPTVRPPIFTVSFIVICVGVFLYQLGFEDPRPFIMRWGLIPADLTGAGPSARYASEGPGSILTLFSSMFLHGGWGHLLGNMLFLWIFGNNIEDDLGHGRFVIFYILCGLAAAFAQVAFAPDSTIPMVGASGAISGVLGAYMIMYPKARILTLIFLGFFITWAHIPAVWFLGIWFLIQIFSAFGGSGAGVAWWAHIGGFVAGVGLLYVMRPRKKTIFQRRRKGPWG